MGGGVVKTANRPALWEPWFTLKWLKEHAEDWNKRGDKIKRSIKEELKNA
jgi:hypothetical protein